MRVKPKGCRLSTPSNICLVGGTQIVRVKPKDVGYRLLLRYPWSGKYREHTSGVARGGHGPRAQVLEGAPAQFVGANFK